MSDEEFRKIEEIVQVLLPVKLVVEVLCRSDADLMTAEIAFEELFNDLKNMESNIAKDMLTAFENRIKNRWDPVVAGLLKYLHNPSLLKKPPPNQHKMFKMPSRPKLETLAHDLLIRHYGKDDIDGGEVEVANQEPVEKSFAERLQERIDKFSASTSLSKPSSFQTALKKEMD